MVLIVYLKYLFVKVIKKSPEMREYQKTGKPLAQDF